MFPFNDRVPQLGGPEKASEMTEAQLCRSSRRGHAGTRQNWAICRVAVREVTKVWCARIRQGGCSYASALLPRVCAGTGVGSGLGPGLTRDSADAAPGCLCNDPSAGSQFGHPPAQPAELPGLGKRPGFTGPTASRCVPSLNRERDGNDHRRRKPAITGGVDTHSEVHVAAALDPVGGLLGTREFPATAAGYAALLCWLGKFGDVALVGVEGTGSYGAGLARYLAPRGVRVVEVNRGPCFPVEILVFTA
jgi:hypothetical protein